MSSSQAFSGNNSVNFNNSPVNFNIVNSNVNIIYKIEAADSEGVTTGERKRKVLKSEESIKWEPQDRSTNLLFQSPEALSRSSDTNTKKPATKLSYLKNFYKEAVRVTKLTRKLLSGEHYEAIGLETCIVRDITSRSCTYKQLEGKLLFVTETTAVELGFKESMLASLRVLLIPSGIPLDQKKFLFQQNVLANPEARQAFRTKNAADQLNSFRNFCVYLEAVTVLELLRAVDDNMNGQFCTRNSEIVNNYQLPYTFPKYEVLDLDAEFQAQVAEGLVTESDEKQFNLFRGLSSEQEVFKFCIRNTGKAGYTFLKVDPITMPNVVSEADIPEDPEPHQLHIRLSTESESEAALEGSNLAEINVNARVNNIVAAQRRRPESKHEDERAAKKQRTETEL